MKKMKLSTTLAVGTALVVCLAFGGVLATRSLTENTVLANVDQEQVEERIEGVGPDYFDQIERMTLKEYYEEYLEVSPSVLAEFEKVYALDPEQTKTKDLSNDQHEYLSALIYLIQEGDQPILKKHEVKEVIDDSGNEMVIKLSLQSSLSDVNALSEAIDSTTPIVAICEKYGVDPNGTIGTLTTEMIMEMDQALFEVSDHPSE